MAKTIGEQIDDYDGTNDMPVDFVEVTLPSGGAYPVHKREAEYFEERCRRYVADNEFSNVSDFQDLDRVVIFETLVWRFGAWSMQGKNWWGEAVDDQNLQKAIKEYSGECRQVKSALGLDKVARDRQKGVDSPAQYIKNLGVRGKHFGYKRNEEFQKIMELGMELRAMLTLYSNCNEEERRQQHVTHDQVFAWIENFFMREYDEIDRKFRQEGDEEIGAQKMWINDQ